MTKMNRSVGVVKIEKKDVGHNKVIYILHFSNGQIAITKDFDEGIDADADREYEVQK